MSKRLHFLLLAILPIFALGQYSGNANDWVDFSKTYYKVQVNEDGIYRVPTSVLTAAGMPAASIMGADLQMFKNGEEVPIYVSSSAMFGGADYVEFYGEKNDGEMDTPLYKDPIWQPNTHRSLFSDKSSYFITANAGGNNLRIVDIPNILTNLPAKEEYYWEKVVYENLDTWYAGKVYPLGGSALFSSAFEQGEGFLANNVLANTARNYNLVTNSIYTAGNLQATLDIKPYKPRASSVNNNNFELKIGPTIVNRSFTTSNAINMANLTAQYNASDLTEGQTVVNVKNTVTGERYRLANLELTYPRKFEFQGNTFKQITRDDSGSKYYELLNFETGSGNVVLHDLTTNERITTTYNPTLQIRSSVNSGNNFVVTTDVKNISTASEFVPIDYTANISIDYVLVYHKSFKTPLNGTDYIQAYVDHRASAIGGNKNVLAVDIESIYNQFAYGINSHNGAIKNLISELNDSSIVPEHVFLVGKGYAYTSIFNNPSIEEQNYIPPFGHPANDNLSATPYYDVKSETSIGRIAARNTAQLKVYYDKIVEYETVQNDTSDAVQTKDKIWMKEALHLGGGANQGEQNIFKLFLNNYKAEAEDQQFGAKVTSVFKTSTDPIQIAESVVIDSLIDRGISLVTFFGHAAPNAFEFNLRDPSNYENEGRYPVILTNGCYVGNLYGENPTLSEDFVLEPNKGAIAFMGPIQFGIAQGMNNYTQHFYENLAFDNYTKSIGYNIRQSLNESVGTGSGIVPLLTAEQMIFHGDPAIDLNTHDKQDYLIDEEDVSFKPEVITADDDTFDVIATIFNIGKAVKESVNVTLTRILPNGNEEIYTQTVEDIYYSKEVVFTLRTDAIANAGLNSFNIFIDENDNLDEITRVNNSLLNPIPVTIVSNTVTPVYPYEYGITNNSDVELKASSVQIYDTQKPFVFEIDTTELFNSPLKETTTINSIGGLVKWNPAITMQEGTVYYWRTKIDEPDALWRKSSFIYLAAYSSGWNQSHYYQWLNNDFSSVELDTDRDFKFAANTRNITVRTGNQPGMLNQEKNYFLDGSVQFRYTCHAEFAIAVFDGNSGIPWENTLVSGRTGLYNSYYCNPRKPSLKAFNFRARTTAERADMMAFLDQIPAGNYVLIYSQNKTNSILNNWAGDPAPTLFDKLAEYGGTTANTLIDDSPYMLFYRKDVTGFDPAYDVTEVVGPDINYIIDENLFITGNWSIGQMNSPIIGPAASWNQFQWDWNNSLDNDATGDGTTYDIVGIRNDGTVNLLFDNQTASTLDLSGVNAATYPKIQLIWNVQDPVNFTPPQIQHWRIVYEAVPELAIKADGLYNVKDTNLPRGKLLEFTFGVENISDVDMSPVLVEYVNTYPNNTRNTSDKRYGALAKGDSYSIDHTFDTNCECAYGTNSMLIDVNPNNDQLEQYHFNNVAVIRYEVEKDRANPYLDVTFDGIHIIDGDTVSDNPNIVITLDDENQYLALDNPEDFKILLQEPGVDTLTIFTHNDFEVTFYAANSGGLEDQNKAVIEFKPGIQDLLIPGEYSMIVQGKDISDNNAGDNDYKISFNVTDEDLVTRIINYPNPFSTRTEFIAEIVGDAPDYILIQIFAPNGKVIKEIATNGADVSPSGGNNFYKIAEWDGRDDYGDPVGNGLYYYKVSMKRAGSLIDPTENEDVDKYFHNGLGKLYILR